MFRQVMVMVVLLCATEAFAAAPPTSGRDPHGDPLPPGAVMRLGTMLGRYAQTWGDRVQLFFSPDSKELLTHADRRYKSWDVATRRETAWGRKLPGDVGSQQLPDGETLVTASLERSERTKFGARWVIRRWRWGKEGPLGEVEIDLELRDLWAGTRVAAFSGDGKYLVSWGHDEPVVVWDAENGKRLHDLGQKVRGQSPAAFTPDGKGMVLLTALGGIHVYDLATGKLSRTLIEDDTSGRDRALYPVNEYPSVSPDGKLLAVCSRRALMAFDLKTGRLLATHDGITGPTQFSPDGKTLMCGGRKEVRLFEPRSLESVRTFEPHHEIHGAIAVRFSPDGKTIALAGRQVLTYWDVATGKPKHPTHGHLWSVASVTFSPRGGLVATGGSDGTARVWDLETGRQLHSFAGHDRAAISLAFSPDGKTLATGDGATALGYYDNEAQVRLYDLGAGKLSRQFMGHLGGVKALAFSADGQRLATGGLDDRVRLWEVKTARRLAQARDLLHARAVAFVENGSVLIEEPKSGCHLFDGKEVHPLTDEPVHLASYCAGQKRVVIVGAKTIEWRDARTMKLTESVSLPKGISLEAVSYNISYERAAISPDGELLATPLKETPHVIAVWHLPSGKRVARLEGHASHVAKLAFSADGRWLASASSDTTALIWDVEKFRPSK